MFAGGMTEEQIAKARGLAVSTIVSHLATYVESGQMGLGELLPENHIQELQAYIAGTPRPASTSAVKDAVSPDITYGEIRLFLKIRGMDL